MTNSLHMLISRYLDEYASVSCHTARAKKSDLNKFVIALNNYKLSISDAKALNLSDIKYSSVVYFIEHQLSLRESVATVRRRFATVKHFCKFASIYDKEFQDPCFTIKTPTLSVEKPRSLSESEVSDLIKYLNLMFTESRNFRDARTATILMFMLKTGLRADELRCVRLVQIQDNWLKNVRTKSRKYRDIYLCTELLNLLNRYLKLRDYELSRRFKRDYLECDEQLPVFISLKSANLDNINSFRLNSKTIYNTVRNFKFKDLKLYPHIFRHTFATTLLRSSNDIRLVAQALGHSDVKITMRYTVKTNEDLASAIEKM